MGSPSKFLWRLGHNTARPDILAADEAEPIDPLLIRQSDGFRFLAHFAPKKRGSKRDHSLHSLAQSRDLNISDK
jgi:hypothetical protein